jgi:hypothetical protein
LIDILDRHIPENPMEHSRKFQNTAKDTCDRQNGIKISILGITDAPDSNVCPFLTFP